MHWNIPVRSISSRDFSNKTLSPGVMFISEFFRSWPHNCNILWGLCCVLELESLPSVETLKVGTKLLHQVFYDKYATSPTNLKFTCFIYYLTTEKCLPMKPHDSSLDCSRLFWLIPFSFKYEVIFRISK